MIHISARTRIAIGQVSIVVSVLMLAMIIGLVPDRRGAVMKGRAALCEAIALNTSVLLVREDFERLAVIVEAVVKRNPDVLSAGLRRADGKLLIAVGAHESEWEALNGERSVESEIQVPIRAGKERWGVLEMRFEPLSVPGFFGLIRNPWLLLIIFVSSLSFLLFYFYLRKMLQHLDPSKAVPGRVRTALDTLAEGLLVVDTKERIVLANQAFADCVGEAPEKLLGRAAADVPWIRPDDQQAGFVFPWTPVLQDQTPPENVTLGLKNTNGESRTFMVNTSSVMGHDGNCKGVLVSLEDVTVLERQKVELSESKAEADEANRAKSEFLARMSHEIRTPMNAILGFTDVLRRGFEDNEAERQEYLGTIHSSGTHLLNLINNILDLSKVESGRMEVELAPCSPRRIVSEVATVLQVKAHEKGIKLEARQEGDIPETVLSDAGRLRQSLTNLVGNAIKFTDTGGVSIVTRFLPSNKKPQLAIDVIDTGIGMSQEAAENIFEAFVQADTTITRRFGGTGLGLSISRSFAQALGGDIHVSSEVGRGSVFTVTIDTGDLEGVAMLEPGADEQFGQAGAVAHDVAMELPPARILLVDDSPPNRKLMKLVLSRAGTEVQTAENGQVAVDLATSQEFDLILMDMQMPVMNGYDATRTLRDKGMKLPIIALTADAMKGAEEKCVAAGCSGFLTKPIDMDVLIQTLAGILGVAEPGTRPSRPTPKAEPKQASTAGGRLLSSLPTDDPEFREIVVEFVDRLGQQLDAMQEAFARNELEELARLAHWLKGSGGTAGFAAFTAPARSLQEQAQNGNVERIEESISHLRQLAGAIEVPAIDSGTGAAA